MSNTKTKIMDKPFKAIKENVKSRTVLREMLAPIRMTTGGEKKHPIIIDGDTVYEWVGIYWIDLREATLDDRSKYPQVVEG